LMGIHHNEHDVEKSYNINIITSWRKQ
jgi:hypothetical protein